MAFKCNLTREQYSPYQPLLYFCDSVSFSERRNISDMKFLFKLVNGFINCLEILGFLNFNVTQFKVGLPLCLMFLHK